VSWNDTQEYVQWLSAKTGQKYRLLTEAEFEYAARAGSTTTYPWGETIGKGNANCRGCGSQRATEQTVPVGAYPANAFGLFDMLGNVRQWVDDIWHDSYETAPTDGSSWITGGNASDRVIRGGSWVRSESELRSSVRYYDNVTVVNGDVGFRLARRL
jgi:formylglycine-generating enzyme required for sulfatase activity